MTRMRLLFAVLALTATVALVPAANAAPVVHFIGSGSSAMYTGTFVATVNDIANPNNDATIGVHHYSLKNNTRTCTAGAICSFLHDPRSNAIPNETTQLWVVWNCPAPAGCNGSNATDVWAYGQVDSTVGVRTFLARPTGCAAPCGQSAVTFVVDPAVQNAQVSADVVTPFLFQFGDHNANAACPIAPAAHNNTCDAQFIPSDVWLAISGNVGQTLTGAFTDIRPEDAKYATKRINKPLDTTTWNGLGYCTAGTCAVGAAIVSGIDGTSAATPVNFGLPGTADPITNTVVPTTITTLPVGEAPIVFLANRTDTAGLGAIVGGSHYYHNLITALPTNGVPTVYGIGKLFKSKACEGNNVAFGTTGANVLPPGGTLLTISKVVVPGVLGAGTADYKFTVVSGPAPVAGQRISFVFLSTGNNGTYTIGTVNPNGTVNKLSINNAAAVNQGTASGQALTNDFPIHLAIREPLSGTYNTTEFGAMRIYGGPQGSLTPGAHVPTNSQEQQVIVNNGIGDNPLRGAAVGVGKPCIPSFLTGENGTLATGDKIRSVGSGQEVKYVHDTQNSMGYAFFSFGNVSSIATSTAYGYLTVDGVDPIFSSYNGGSPGQPGDGQLPFCDATGATAPSCLGFAVWGSLANIFPNLRNGTYPVWSLLRGLCDTTNAHCLTASDPKGLQALIAAAQADIDNGTGVPDFLPFNQITQTRAHFQAGANFGAPTGPLGQDSPEAGGDVGGCIIPHAVSAGTVECHQ